MNSKLFKLCIILLVCCLLAACGAEPECQHQWSEADCLNASVCALCEEVQGEALGHDWVEATCEAAEHCNRCSETQGEALGHSYGEWLLDAEDMFRVCDTCLHIERAEIDYALYLEQHIYGRWNMCSKIENGRFYSADMLPQHEADAEYCFYEDGRVSSLGFEEKEISPSWSFDHGEYSSKGGNHYIYISFPESNALSSAYFLCDGDEVYYEVPLNDEGDRLSMSNRFGDAAEATLAGIWNTWSGGGIYSISFSEDRSFTADIDGEISGFWQPRQPIYNGGSTGTLYVMLNYYKDGKACSEYAMLSSFSEDKNQQAIRDYLSLSMYVQGTYSHFSPDSEQFLTEALSKADSAHLGTWTSIDYIVSTPNNETYSSDEEKGLSTEYSISFMEDGSFSAKLHKELSGQWKLRGIRRENGGAVFIYSLTARGLREDYSYFQIRENGDGYVYTSYPDYSSANYSFRQMNEEEIAARNELAAAAPGMVVGEWFSSDGQGFKAMFNEDGTFTVSTDTSPEVQNCTGYWYFNSMNEYDGTYHYYYDIETIIDTVETDSTESTEADISTIDISAALNSSEAEAAEPTTYREDGALWLTVKDGFYTLESRSYCFYGTMTNAEGIDIINEALTAITGHWSASTATEFKADTNESVQVDMECWLDVAEDGSFTGYAGQDIQGSLEFYDVTDSGTRYLLDFSEGPYPSGIFILSDGTLSATVMPYFIEFTK